MELNQCSWLLFCTNVYIPLFIYLSYLHTFTQSVFLQIAKKGRESKVVKNINCCLCWLFLISQSSSQKLYLFMNPRFTQIFKTHNTNSLMSVLCRTVVRYSKATRWSAVGWATVRWVQTFCGTRPVFRRTRTSRSPRPTRRTKWPTLAWTTNSGVFDSPSFWMYSPSHVNTSSSFRFSPYTSFVHVHRLLVISNNNIYLELFSHKWSGAVYLISLFELLPVTNHTHSPTKYRVNQTYKLLPDALTRYIPSSLRGVPHEAH